MSQDSQIIVETLDRMLREQCSKELVDAAEAGTWPAALWDTLAAAGLPLAAAPERLGGSALPLADALSLLKVAGRHALPLPFAETLLAGGLLEHASGADSLPSGPITIALGALHAVAAGDTVTLDGRAVDVPWAQQAELVLCAFELDGQLQLALVPGAGLDAAPTINMAGDPRATLSFHGVAVPRAGVFTHPRLASSDDLLQLLALTRALMMAGAMEGILAMSVSYALERSQFGRPIAAFQAVQQQLAVLAGDAAAAIRAADAALEHLQHPAAGMEMAVAKARVGEAAGRGAEIAHQVHGAMGFTYEHPLHQRTRRLWAWRDEYAAEHHWQAVIGRMVCAGGADALWATLTHTAS